MLISGCATKPEPVPVYISDFCVKTETIFYKGATKAYLTDNDAEVLRKIVALNETRDWFCKEPN